MLNLFNPLFLALSRALRDDDAAHGDAWDQMLDRSELGHNPEQMSTSMGSPIYMPELFAENEQHPH